MERLDDLRIIGRRVCPSVTNDTYSRIGFSLRLPAFRIWRLGGCLQPSRRYPTVGGNETWAVGSIFENLLATVRRVSFNLGLCLETTRETYVGEALLTYRSGKTRRSLISGGPLFGRGR